MLLTSRSIFFFAFQWKAKDGNHLSQIMQVAEAGGWQKAQTSQFYSFSQHNFFHDFVHNAIFHNPNSPVISSFQKKFEQPFYLKVRNKAIGKLPDDGLTLFQPVATFATLDIYEAGVGIFSLTLDCPEGTVRPNELLAINDLGRRLYPQTLNFGGLAAAQNSGLLPVSIGFEDNLEDFSDFDIDPVTGKLPEKFLPKYLRDLLGARFKIFGEKLEVGDILIENTFDDRMFVLSCLIDDATYKGISKSEDMGSPNFLDDPFWYKFIFVDGGNISVRNRALQHELIRAATYPRWSEDGTIFGASRYSFVAVAKYGWLFGPMTGNYAQLVKLCLVQRAAVLRFREDATAISANIARNEDASRIIDKIRELQGDFILFSNRLNFREVTPYEQGIELYDLIRRPCPLS